MPPNQIGFRCVLCLSAVPLAECRLLHCYHGFCNGCMDEWLESNRVGPLRRLRQLHCPTCRKPARESDLGRMFVETVVLDEDSEYQTRLANTITEQTNSTRESIQTITSISSSVQVTRAASGVVNSRDALSRSQYAETEPIVKTVMEKLSVITDDLECRVRPVFERVSQQNQEITSLKAETVRLREGLRSAGLEKQQVEQYLEEALRAGEQLRERGDTAKLAALQKAQEVESLSKEVARLLRQSFSKGNEITDLKEQCNEHQAEIERLNELLNTSKRPSSGKRRLDEKDDDDTSPPLAHGRSPSPLPPTKRALVSRAHNQVTCIGEPIRWKMSPTIVLPPDGSSKTSKPNPFKKPKGIHPRLVNGSPNLAVGSRPKFPSDWNLDHLKEKRRKSEASLPFRIDIKGKPLVPVALGSRQRMTSRS